MQVPEQHFSPVPHAELSDLVGQAPPTQSSHTSQHIPPVPGASQHVSAIPHTKYPATSTLSPIIIYLVNGIFLIFSLCASVQPLTGQNLSNNHINGFV